MVNGPEHIFIERDGKITEYPGHFVSLQKLEDVIQQIVAKVNRMVNEASPIVDVRLLDNAKGYIMYRKDRKKWTARYPEFNIKTGRNMFFHNFLHSPIYKRIINFLYCLTHNYFF